MPQWMKRQPSIACPVCGMRSYSRGDIANGYCGMCHGYTNGTVDDPDGVLMAEVEDRAQQILPEDY